MTDERVKIHVEHLDGDREISCMYAITEIIDIYKKTYGLTNDETHRLTQWLATKHYVPF